MEQKTRCTLRPARPGLVKAIAIQGGHRFGKGYQPIVDAILQEAQ